MAWGWCPIIGPDSVTRLILKRSRSNPVLHKTARSIAAFVLLAGLTAMDAQQKPDFTGEWILNRQASTLSASASATESGALRIEHREPSVRVQLTMVANGKPFETTYEATADGREVSDTQQGRTTVSSMRWDGEALVFGGRITSSNGELVLSFRYELEAGGRRLRATERIRGGGRDQDNVWIFERPR